MADNKRMKKSAAKSYWDKAVKKSSAANRTKASGKKPKKPGEYSRPWRPASKASEGPKKSMKRSAATADGARGRGEAPGQRRTQARRNRVARMNQTKSAGALQKGIKANQRKRPY